MTTAPRSFFITGTDTGVGKTRIACALLAGFRRKGLTTAAVKPIAAGAVDTPEGLRNEDGLALQAQCHPPMTYDEVNPLCLREPVAPHLAAMREGFCLTSWELKNACTRVLGKGRDITLVEGAGGWMVPVGDQETLADLPRILDMPVILVVGMRLGCINHALLTVRAIEAAGVTLAGWVANRIDPDMLEHDATLISLQQRIRAPLLARLPWQPDTVEAGLDTLIPEDALNRLLT